MKPNYTITSIDDLNAFASSLVTYLSGPTAEKQTGATIVTLTGDLGAGKTTLAQHIGRHIGITEPISSPTFVITKYYDIPPVKSQTSNWSRLIHIDAYRLDGHNLDVLGFDDLFADPHNLILIEWPIYITSKLPPHTTNITFSLNPDQTRTLDIMSFIHSI